MRIYINSPEYMDKARDRLLSGIEKDSNDCWIWKRSLDGRGYGQICFLGKLTRSHRMAWILFRGEIPSGLCLCHKCDNPKCCNPDHLFLGTQKDNIRDASKKGRMSGNHKGEGEHNIKAKLKESDIPVIRNLFVPYKMSCNKIAKLYNVHVSTIQRIIYHEGWTHV